MKILIPTVGLSLFLLIIVVFTGQLFFITPIEKNAAELLEKAQKFRDEIKLLEARAANLKPVTPDTKTAEKIRLLNAGEEHLLFGRTLANASEAGILLSGANLLKILSIKSGGGNERTAPTAPPNPGNAPGTLPQLDANGMPIGATTEEEPEEKSLDFLPLQISFKGTFRSLGKFLHEQKKQLPLFIVRRMTVQLDGSGLGKGSIDLVFPYGAGSSR